MKPCSRIGLALISCNTAFAKLRAKLKGRGPAIKSLLLWRAIDTMLSLDKLCSLFIFFRLQTKWETLKRALPVCTDKKIDASQLHSLSAGQLMMLRRLAVLKLTASMEKFTNKASHSW